MPSSEADRPDTQFCGGLSATQTHIGLKQALAALQSAEKHAVLWFAEILRRKLFRELGYSSIQAYASEALGFTPSKTSQFIRLADSLRELPELRRSVALGSLSWTKAREVAKVAMPATEREWIAQALAVTSRELESAVRQSREQAKSAEASASFQGSLLDAAVPVDPESLPAVTASDPARGSRVLAGAASSERAKGLNLRFSPEEWARFEALVEQVRKRSRAGAMRQARWEVLVMAGLEALLDSSRKPAPAEFTRVNSSSPYQIVIHRCESCGSAVIKTGRREQRLSESSYERIACDARILEPGEKNRSTIPPAVRRAVLARDGHCCQVKGCGSSRFLEVHHIKAQSDGGRNRMENLVTLCSTCHQLLHEKRLAGPLLGLPGGSLTSSP